MSKFRYPVDTALFEEMRLMGKVYVDKTDLMYDMTDRYKYVFLARPRRFGKSLLCNTLKSYFEGKRELFEGLKIMQLERQWNRHPVLHFTMSGLKNMSIAEARDTLEGMIEKYERTYECVAVRKAIGARFRELIHSAYKQTGQKAVVILDEYDSPILRLMYDAEQLDAMRSLLREFYQVLKDEEDSLRFVFITGVTKFSQLSIFSELNNLMQISMLDEYSGICGITQEELNQVLRPCVEEYAKALEITVDEAYALLKKNYDGYHFSKNSQDVYAPFSLLRALATNSTDGFWFESGTTTSLIEHLQHYPEFNILDLDGVELRLNAFNAPCEKARTPIPLLYQSGYLTIDRYDREEDMYTLHFPNYEVRQGMIEGLTNYLMDTDDLERDAAVRTMARAVRNDDLPAMLDELRSYIATIPYDIITKKEWMAKKKSEAFYKLLLYVIFSLLNGKVDTEVKSLLGRADVVIKTNTHVYVMELKVDKTVEDALSQIDSKGYAIPYEAGDRTVVKCGVIISSEQRNIVQWRAVDSEGKIVEKTYR